MISLDLSYNDLLDLDATLRPLKMLANLRVLMLHGNPFCALPSYKAKVRVDVGSSLSSTAGALPLTRDNKQVRKALPLLHFLDGRDLRAKKGAESAPTEAGEQGVAGERSVVEFALPEEREDKVHLRLEILSLTVTTPADLVRKPMSEEEQAAAEAAKKDSKSKGAKTCAARHPLYDGNPAHCPLSAGMRHMGSPATTSHGNAPG